MVALSSRSSHFFSLSEVKFGLVPAVISTYVVKKIGEGYAREFMLTGERIDAQTAYRIGLVNRLAEPEQLEAEVDRLIDQLIAGGCTAVAVNTHHLHQQIEARLAGNASRSRS